MPYRPRQWAEPGFIGFGFARQRKGCKRPAMETTVKGDHPGAAGKGARKLQRVFHRLGPGIGQH